MAISDELTKYAENAAAVEAVKQDIKQAFIDNGVDMTDVPFTDYAGKISEVSPTLSGDAAEANVLAGKTFYNTDAKTKKTGTMTDNGAVSKSITPSTSSQSYTIPAGYHNGNGKVNVSAIPASSSASNMKIFGRMIRKPYCWEWSEVQDLGATYTIKGYSIGGGSWNGGTAYVEYSTNNSTWTTLASVTFAAQSSSNTNVGYKSGTCSVSARYVRFRATDNNNDGGHAFGTVMYI